MRFHETTGGVYDTLAQMSVMRGDYENASEYLQRAAEAYGAYGRQTSRWYEWSVRVITARLAIRRGTPDTALALADEIAQSPNAPPAEALQGELIAIEALLLARDSSKKASAVSTQVETRLDPRTTPGAWGEYLRLRGELRARQTRTTEAYHDIAQSSSVFELVGERYQAAVSQLALGRLASRAGARSTADRHFQQAAEVFRSLGAKRDLEEVNTRNGGDAARSGPASTSAHPPTPTTRSCAGWSMPRFCRSCSHASSRPRSSRRSRPTSRRCSWSSPAATSA